MKAFVVYFKHPKFASDCRVVGAFGTKKKAIAGIKAAIKHDLEIFPLYNYRTQKFKENYHITECEFNDALLPNKSEIF